jgi:hypothetical protein
MRLEYAKLDNSVHLLKLSGRLDIVRTGEIETKFAGYCAVEKGRVLVDLAASISWPPLASDCWWRMPKPSWVVEAA